MSKNNDRKKLIKTLWEAAEQLWSNSDLKPSEYAMPVLGLIFLKYADYKFDQVDKIVQKKYGGGRIGISKDHYHKEGAMYLKPEARYGYLLNLPEDIDVGKAIDEAMREVEEENESVKAAGLPKNYSRIDNDVLRELLRLLNGTSSDFDGDIFGLVYEEFLGNFHKTTGEKGGEFFTPTSIVRLIVEIIEPFRGKIFDPACGSGGMFVQSARFIKSHKKDPTRELPIFGQELAAQNVQIANMNLAIHGLQGNIKVGNTYKEDIHDSVGKFDYVMANPPFNSKKINKEKLKGDKRFPFGLPKPDNGNYIWIQIFYSALNETGKAGFVMSNPAGNAGGTERDIREKIINKGVVDTIVAVGSNFFHTVNLPCALWFFDKNKVNNDYKNKVLFIDARRFYKSIDTTHREFSEEHLEFLGDLVRLYHGEKVEYPQNPFLLKYFPNYRYKNINGLCKVVLVDKIQEQDWSLNPRRYVGIEPLSIIPKKKFDELKLEQNTQYVTLHNEMIRLKNEINNDNKYILDPKLLFYEWFVEYRYPGYEKIKFVDSEIGNIPKGWELVQIKDVLKKYIGGGWGSDVEDTVFSVPAYVIRGTDIPRAKQSTYSSCPLRYHKESNYRNRKLLLGDIIFEVSGGSEDQPIGRTLLINQRLLDNFQKPVICASFCKLLRPNDNLSPEYLFWTLDHWYDSKLLEVYEVQSTGISNYQFEDFIKNVKIPIPDKKTLDKFTKLTAKIQNLTQVLGETRGVLSETNRLLY